MPNVEMHHNLKQIIKEISHIELVYNNLSDPKTRNVVVNENIISEIHKSTKNMKTTRNKSISSYAMAPEHPKAKVKERNDLWAEIQDLERSSHHKHSNQWSLKVQRYISVLDEVDAQLEKIINDFMMGKK